MHKLSWGSGAVIAAVAPAAAAAVVLAVAVGCDGSADEAARLKREVQGLRTERDELRRELDDATAELNGLRAQVKELLSQIENLDVEKELLQREASRLAERANSLEERNRTLNEQLEDLAKRTAGRPESLPAARETALAPQVQEAADRLDALSAELFQRGELDIARSVALTAEAVGAASAELLYRIAFCEASRRDYAAAAEWYERAWQALGDDVERGFRVKILGNWGVALARTGNEDTAEKRYRQALAIDDTAAPVWFNLALILADDPDLKHEAVEAFRKHVIHGGDRGVTARRRIVELQRELGAGTGGPGD